MIETASDALIFGLVVFALVDAIIPDDHKSEIAAGVADFMAFRDARGGA